MKKAAILMVIVLGMTILVGCGSGENTAERQTARGNIESDLSGVTVESGTKGVSDINYMDSFWWGFNFESNSLKDGVYRGAYILPNEVTVQFTINGNVISNGEYLRLGLEDKDYLKEETFKELREKYEAILGYLEGKDIRTALNDLHSKDKLPETVDDTVEVGKVISAIHDAFNRGVYYTNP